MSTHRSSRLLRFPGLPGAGRLLALASGVMLSGSALFALDTARPGADLIDPTVRTSGSVVSPDVVGPIEIAYDDRGVPTVTAGDRRDAYFAEGYLHAQNRFTQMDLSRRLSAGELAELVGPSMVGRDRVSRGFRMRRTALAVVEAMDDAQRAVLESYTRGVNAGLADLPSPPPEYAIIGAAPSEWKQEDCVLVMLSFMRMLDWTAQSEARHAGFYLAMPPAIREFLGSPLSRLDAPVSTLEKRRPSLIPIPSREMIMLRELEAVPETVIVPPGGGGPPRGDLDFDGFDGFGDGDDDDGGDDAPSTGPELPGSNNWAISGNRTSDGRAIMASDPHLGLTLPGAWYRIRMLWPDHDLVGLSIPGIPGVIIGSNGHVAWGFTNLTGDLQDLIQLELDPEDPGRYRTADGWEPFGEVIETIEVKGGEPVRLPLKTTRWGVVNGSYLDAQGVQRDAVVEWAGLHPGLCNFKLFDLEEARTLEQALEVLGSWYGPPQNAVVASSDGRVGYTITGFLPDRGAVDGRRPYGLWDGTEPWTSRPSAPRPVVIDPPTGFVQTANNRTTDLETARRLGYAWAPPSRARRIADVLSLTNEAEESDMLALQMDPTVLAFGPWRSLILETIPADEPDPDLFAARKALVEWNGRADVDQVGVTLLGDARDRMIDDIKDSVRDWATREGLGEAIVIPEISDEPYLRVIEDRKMNWLPQGPEPDWDAWIRNHVRESVASGALVPWGERNRVTLESPLAPMAPPPMDRMLRNELGPQSGHWYAPKVLNGGFGASARLVVSPGREDDGILLTPGGQSGNPLSPHFRDLTRSWVEGEPRSLLPGEAAATFTIEPGRGVSR